MTQAQALPLVALHRLDDTLAWHRGQAVSAGQFIAEAQALVATLPATGRALNLCQDRYHFALGLAAALLRGQTSLLPPNALPETLAQVGADGPPPYVLADEAIAGAGSLPVRRVARPPAVAPAAQVPVVDAALAAVCLLTSGSTGAPQPHAKRWGTLVRNIAGGARRLAEHLGRADLRGLGLLATVPAQHSYGLESSVLLALLGGATLVDRRPFYPADIAQALHELPAPRALVSTPFHLKTLLRAGVALPPVALGLSATAPLSPQLAAEAETAFEGRLVEIYGCTEAGQVASRRTTAGETWRTLDGLRIDAAAGPEGEQFIVSGGHVETPTPLADVLVLNDAQHFRLLGRANDLIHVAGKRSSLAHLNFHLNRIEGVEDGSFWLPDDVAEGIVRTVAFVVAPRLSAREITAALREHLEPAFVPRRVVHVPSLPREATGKLTMAALRRFALATLAAQDAGADHAPIDVPADHPAFAGHFPGHPVLPGALLLSLVLDVLLARPGPAALLGASPVLDQAKFLAPVRPGDALRLQWQAQGKGLAFEVHAGATVVARGQWGPGP